MEECLSLRSANHRSDDLLLKLWGIHTCTMWEPQYLTRESMEGQTQVNLSGLSELASEEGVVYS